MKEKGMYRCDNKKGLYVYVEGQDSAETVLTEALNIFGMCHEKNKGGCDDNCRIKLLIKKAEAELKPAKT